MDPYTVLNDKPTVTRKTIEYQSEFPRGWYIVVPQSVQFDLATEDTPNAAFMFESHAELHSERWMPFVSILKNGEKEE